ncbi:exonuclease SbcCD subunit D [Candidatus Pacearchaeota archaeon]|nr:exonuclease SbcCD subunit D [Candidatus Pacearchaeota archaeon]
MKFAHFADCHLGAWRYPELQELNLQSFRKAIDTSIKERVEFVLIAGDIFDSAYPPIDILKESFSEFRKLKESNIPCFIIAGSHDYSASGKSFLDVLEKAGLCVNVHKAEERDGSIILLPTLHRNCAIYGYPGKKSSMEMPELLKIKLHDTPGFYKILMLHTSLSFAANDMMESINENTLPHADYYALGHLHIDKPYKNYVYAGPLFPNNFQELEELGHGKFYIVENSIPRKIPLIIKNIEPMSIEIKNTLLANQIILTELSKKNIEDKIVLLRLYGNIEKGKISNINFSEIEEYSKSKKCYALIKSTSQLFASESDITAEFDREVDNIQQIEEELVKSHINHNPSEFSHIIMQLMRALDVEKKEDENSEIFASRLMEEVNRIIKIQ